MDKTLNKTYNAFTFPEALLVLGSVSLVIALVFVVIKPDFQFKKARDIKRNNDIVEILDALDAYKADNLGKISIDINSELKMIGNSTQNCISTCGDSITKSCIDLEKALTPTYIATIPQDPLIGSDAITSYAVKVDEHDRFEIRACTPELNNTIVITR